MYKLIKEQGTADVAPLGEDVEYPKIIYDTTGEIKEKGVVHDDLVCTDEEFARLWGPGPSVEEPDASAASSAALPAGFALAATTAPDDGTVPSASAAAAKAFSAKPEVAPVISGRPKALS